MKAEVFVTLDAPLQQEFIHDDVGWIPAIATVVLRHASGIVGFQANEGRDTAIAGFLGDCVMIERCNSPRWRLAAGSTLTSRDARYYSKGFINCTQPQEAIIEELQRADRNQRLARQNEMLARHGKPCLQTTPSIFDSWHDELGRIRVSALRFLIGHCSTASLWAHSEFGTYARVFGNDPSSALAAVSASCKAAGLSMVVVPQQSELPAW